MNIDESQLVGYANTMIERVNSWPGSGACTFDIGWLIDGKQYWVMKTKIIPMTKSWDNDRKTVRYGGSVSFKQNSILCNCVEADKPIQKDRYK